MTKNDLTIISKPHAHLHNMKKIHAHLHNMKITHGKFQNNQYKTVRGIALTTGTQCLYIVVKND